MYHLHQKFKLVESLLLFFLSFFFFFFFFFSSFLLLLGPLVLLSTCAVLSSSFSFLYSSQVCFKWLWVTLLCDWWTVLLAMSSIIDDMLSRNLPFSLCVELLNALHRSCHSYYQLSLSLSLFLHPRLSIQPFFLPPPPPLLPLLFILLLLSFSFRVFYRLSYSSFFLSLSTLHSFHYISSPSRFHRIQFNLLYDQSKWSDQQEWNEKKSRVEIKSLIWLRLCLAVRMNGWRGENRNADQHVVRETGRDEKKVETCQLEREKKKKSSQVSERCHTRCNVKKARKLLIQMLIMRERCLSPSPLLLLLLLALLFRPPKSLQLLTWWDETCDPVTGVQVAVTFISLSLSLSRFPFLTLTCVLVLLSFFSFSLSTLLCLFVSIDLTEVDSCWARGNRKCVNKLTLSLQLLLITLYMNMNVAMRERERGRERGRERESKKTLSQQWHRWMTIHLLHDATQSINTLMYSWTLRECFCFLVSLTLLIFFFFLLFFFLPLHPCKMLVVRRDCHDEAKYLIRNEKPVEKTRLERRVFLWHVISLLPKITHTHANGSFERFNKPRDEKRREEEAKSCSLDMHAAFRARYSLLLPPRSLSLASASEMVRQKERDRESSERERERERMWRSIASSLKKDEDKLKYYPRECEWERERERLSPASGFSFERWTRFYAQVDM